MNERDIAAGLIMGAFLFGYVLGMITIMAKFRT